MRSSNQSSPFHALGRVSTWVEKARRSVLARRPTVRWGLAATVLAVVMLHRPRERWGPREAPRPSAFVRLETEGDRLLPSGTIQSITTNLTGAVPGLVPESITVVDRRGHKYLDAGNPALSALSLS